MLFLVLICVSLADRNGIIRFSCCTLFHLGDASFTSLQQLLMWQQALLRFQIRCYLTRSDLKRPPWWLGTSWPVHSECVLTPRENKGPRIRKCSNRQEVGIEEMCYWSTVISIIVDNFFNTLSLKNVVPDDESATKSRFDKKIGPYWLEPGLTPSCPFCSENIG